MKRRYGKMAVAVSLAVVVVFAAGTVFACQGYENRLKRAMRELNQFEKLVVEPLKVQRDQLRKELDREVNNPGELGRKIKELEKMIKDLQALETALNGKISAQDQRLDKLTAEIEDLDLKIGSAQASGKKKIVKQLQAQREERIEKRKEVRLSRRENYAQLGRAQGEVDGAMERIPRLQARIDAIVSLPPTRGELEEALAGIEAMLGDEKQLRKDREAEVKFFEKVLQLCLDKDGLEAVFQDYREAAIKIRAYGCESVDGVNEGRRQALEDMNCR